MRETVSFKEYIEQGFEDKIHDFTVNGECSSCGNCCTRALHMTKKEISRIKDYVKTNNITEYKHLSPLAKVPYDMTCPFRNDKKNICTIYEVRPKVCRLFICNKPTEAKENREKFEKSTQIVVDTREEFFL